MINVIYYFLRGVGVVVCIGIEFLIWVSEWINEWSLMLYLRMRKRVEERDNGGT